MPVVTIQIAKGRKIGQKRELVKAVTEALVSTIDVEPDWVTVLIMEFDRNNWSTGGVLHSDKFGPGLGKESLIMSSGRRRPRTGRRG